MKCLSSALLVGALLCFGCSEKNEILVEKQPVENPSPTPGSEENCRIKKDCLDPVQNLNVDELAYLFDELERRGFQLDFMESLNPAVTGAGLSELLKGKFANRSKLIENRTVIILSESFFEKKGARLKPKNVVDFEKIWENIGGNL